MGVSVGWADIYPTTLPEQFINVNDLPDGDYAVIARQDTGGHLLEKTRKNNTAIGCVRITGYDADDITCPSTAG